MEGLSKWYENLTYIEAKNILREKMDNLKMSFIAAGYYLKYIRDHELFLEDGYESIWEFAEDNYGIKKSTASRWMSMNDKFSQGGNSPVLAEEFRGFEKSQLQEMLYLDDKQLQEVKPDMTVKEIREARKPEPLSAYGTKRRVYPEDSLIKTSGCDGGHDCFMCGHDCMICGEDRYCREAPTGNPFPCELVGSIPALRNDFGDRCLFVNQDLAEHYPTGDARPCCKDCKAPCSMECDRAFSARRVDADSAEDSEITVATSQQTEEDQVPGQMSVEDFPEPAPYPGNEEREIVQKNEEPEEVPEKAPTGEADTGIEVELSDKTDLQLLEEMLWKENNYLKQALQCYNEKDVHVRRQRIRVGALAAMKCTLEEIEIPEPEEKEIPAIPKLKNNDARKAFLDNYQIWPIWFEVPQASEVYHRLDLPDGSSIVICEYHQWLSWKEKYSHEDPHSTGTRKYLLKPGYHYLQDCCANTSALVEHLKNVQKGAR